jgi:hypothetical protein
MTRTRVIVLAGIIPLFLSAPLHAGGRGSGRKTLTWDSFRPRGLGIHVTKPSTLKLKPRKVKRGYVTFSGTDTVTGTKLTLYVRRAGRSAAQLKADLRGLTGIAATQMIPLMSLGATRGFQWQQGLLHNPASGVATGVLLARHAKRALSYVLVVTVHIGVATRYLPDFKQAYLGLKAIP